jgi:MFS superfamily sulfate permease-like transporter
MTRDLLASAVVFLVALPLCMGIAIASGAPPAAGLITGIIGGIIVGSISGAPFQVSGPAAGLAVIVFELVNEHGLKALGPLVLLAGLIQMAAGILKLGRWFRAIAPPVVFGMLAGIGVLILASQFHVMVDDKPKSGGIANIVSIPGAIVKGLLPIDQHSYAAMIGLITIGVILLWNAFRPAKLRFIPGLLLGAVTASAIANMFKLPIHYVDIPRDLLGSLTLTSFDTVVGYMFNAKMFAEGVGLALVASAETMLCAVAVDRMHTGPRAKFDRELAAQGFGNVLCGFFGGLPMTGVIVRSAANIDAGAQTRLAAILHGVWILGFALFLPGVLSLIPASSLAAILVFTGIKLVNVANIREIAKFGKAPVAIYGITLLGIVCIDLLSGVVIGVAVSFLKLVYELTHLVVRVERVKGSDQVNLYLSGSATFLGLPKLAGTLDTIPNSANLHVHFEHLNHIDHACIDALSNWERQNAAAGARLIGEWDDLIARYKRPAPTAAKPRTPEPVEMQEA